MIILMIVDDHREFLEAISHLSQQDPEIEVVCTAESAEMAMDMLESTLPDVLVLDVSLPGLDGVELSMIIEQQYPTIKVLMLSMHQDKRVIFSAIRAGASGYVLKDDVFDCLIPAIKCVYNQKLYLSPSIIDVCF